MTAKKNRVRCYDCLKFKTRVIPKEKLPKDEFGSSMKVNKKMQMANGNGVRVFYCFYERNPLIDNPSIFKRIIPDCLFVETEEVGNGVSKIKQ